MADFIHCNACFTLPDQSRKHFLYACGHIVCQRCKERVPDHCVICNKQCNAIELSQITASAQGMFVDPLALEKKHHREIMSALSFQKMHRQRLITYLLEQNRKAKKLHEYAVSEARKRSHADREIQKLKDENTQLKQHLSRMMRMSQQVAPTPNKQSRRRHNAIVNDTFGGFPMQNPLINDSGVSLPDTSFRHSQQGDNFFGFGASPYFVAQQSSPVGFQFRAECSTIADSPTTMMNGGCSPYNAGWIDNNMPPMIRKNAVPPQQLSMIAQQPGRYMSKIAAAFRASQT